MDLNQQTLGQLLLAAADAWPDSLALSVDSTQRTYAQWARRALRCLSLFHSAGLKRGDHIGLFLPNCVEYQEILYAAALGGMVPVTLNARNKAHELQFVAPHSDIKALFIDAHASDLHDFRAIFTEAFPSYRPDRIEQSFAEAPELRVIYTLRANQPATDYENALMQAREAVPETMGPQDTALIMYTSGTTANPKGCLLSHRSIIGNAHATVRRWRLTTDDCIYDPLPFFHMSTVLPIAMSLMTGGSLFATAHFQTDAAWACLTQNEITIGFITFPTLIQALLQHPDFRADHLPGLRLMTAVGPVSALRHYQKTLPQTAIVSAYGLTEAGGVITFGDPLDAEDIRLTLCGKPFETARIRIVNPETRELLAPGDIGEIEISGECLFDGYYRQAPAPDWLATGDLGMVSPDGHIGFVGRAKDMLKVGGENVAALEIESHLETHPDILLTQVIGVPDERLDEVPAAFIQCTPGKRLQATDVIAHCLGKIARFKIPRYIIFVDAWPMSATKIQKFRLRDVPLGPKHAV
jgi:fatty-acyl-CoA synthase